MKYEGIRGFYRGFGITLTREVRLSCVILDLILRNVLNRYPSLLSSSPYTSFSNPFFPGTTWAVNGLPLTKQLCADLLLVA